MPAPELESSLRAVLAGVTGDSGASVVDLRRLSGGASRETWSFDLVGSDGQLRPLILRRDPPAAPKGNMALEAALISAAGAAGVPVPGLVMASDDRSLLGSSFMVVDRLEGETIPRRILRQPELAPARAGLARACGRILAALHAIPVEAVPGLESPDPLDQYRDVLKALNGTSPVFELTLRWLEGNRPAPRTPAVVHGDFRNGNLIVGPEGIRAVLDWELAHAGDPMEDLGWLCVKSWRFGVGLPVGGFGTYEDLMAGYEEAGGDPVDRSALLWWEVFGNLRWGIICMMQASAHTSRAIRSVELAAIGRRVCEVEWDLLAILPGARTAPGVLHSPAGLEPDRPAAPETPGLGYLHGSPDVAGLVEAVREYLENDVMTATEGRVRFHARVAVNVLGMVERELA
ncbi:MAG: phosphotransferase family protein, partial [Acidimicrobiales bacterium]